MKNTHGIRLEDVLQKPDRFVKALREIYGPFENLLEKEMCEKIAEFYGLKCNERGLVELLK
ncbi:MAG: hypothetical protein ACP5GH_04960 [Nitrososphaeria archaeon]